MRQVALHVRFIYGVACIIMMRTAALFHAAAMSIYDERS